MNTAIRWHEDLVGLKHYEIKRTVSSPLDVPASHLQELPKAVLIQVRQLPKYPEALIDLFACKGLQAVGPEALHRK